MWPKSFNKDMDFLRIITYDHGHDRDPILWFGLVYGV